MYVYIHMCIHAYRYMYTYICVYMHIGIHTHVYIHLVCIYDEYTHVHVYLYGCIHICMYTCTYMHAYTYVCIHVCMYTCTRITFRFIDIYSWMAGGYKSQSGGSCTCAYIYKYICNIQKYWHVLPHLQVSTNRGPAAPISVNKPRTYTRACVSSSLCSSSKSSVHTISRPLKSDKSHLKRHELLFSTIPTIAPKNQLMTFVVRFLHSWAAPKWKSRTWNATNSSFAGCLV